MKILLATYWQLPHLGGVWPLMLKWKKQLEEHGHEVDIFGHSQDLTMFHMPLTGQRLYKEAVLPFLKTKINPESYPDLFVEPFIGNLELNCICMELAAVYFGLDKYDLIHTQDIFSTRSFRRVKPKHTPLVASLHGSVAQEIKLHLLEHQIDLSQSYVWQYYYAREHLGATSSDVTVVSSRWMEHLLTTEYAVPHSKIEVIPYGYDASDFLDKINHSESPIMKPLNKKIIIYTGRLISIKGIDILIAALGQLKMLRDDFVCWIVGEGDAKTALQQQCVELGLEQHVQFLGARDDIPYLLNQADIYVQPSLLDNQPLSVIEAQFAGKPSIVSNAAGLPEMVESGETGYIFQSQNSEQLQILLYALLQNDHLRQEVGNRAQVWASTHWSVSARISQYIQIYERMIHNKE
jgi:L-malate glycosyltransferase